VERLRELEKEDERLRKAVSDLTLEEGAGCASCLWKQGESG
jgi:hypothetical protein